MNQPSIRPVGRDAQGFYGSIVLHGDEQVPERVVDPDGQTWIHMETTEVAVDRELVLLVGIYYRFNRG